MVQTTGGAERLVLAEVFDRDVRVGAGAVLDEITEDGLIVVADNKDLADGRDLSDGGEAVGDDGVAGDFE